LRVTVLGSAASYPGAGQACSSYLVETGRARLLLDCGNGSLSRLAAVADPLSLDAVFVSHNHPDHFLDLLALQAAIRYAPEGPAIVGPLTVHGPAGLDERIACVLDTHGRQDFEAAFAFVPLADGAPVEAGDVAVTPMLVDHIPGTFALRVAGPGGMLCYTSDSRFGPAVLAAAAGADVLLCEATLPEAYKGRAPHMTAGEAGELATQAGAGRLVLTHLWPTADRDELLAAARRTFAGDVALAGEMLAIEIG
jgi:ribonuclease BN (tRNA processing enzyme)